MTGILQVQEALAQEPGLKLRAYQIAARAGTTTRQFCKHVGKWLDHGHLSRERVTGKGWCYYLTEQQLQVYRVKKALGPGVRCAVPKTAACADVDQLEDLCMVHRHGRYSRAVEVPAHAEGKDRLCRTRDADRDHQRLRAHAEAAAGWRKERR